MVQDPQRSKKRRKRLSDRWLDFCDRVAFRLNGEHHGNSRGISLLVGAVLGWIGAIFYPKWLKDKLRRRASKRSVQVEARGFGKFTEFLESIATSVAYRFRAIGNWCYQLVVPEKLIKSTEQAVLAKTVDTYWDLRYLRKKLTKRFVPQWVRDRFGGVAKVFAAGFVFFSAWLKSRDWKKLAWSVPAFLLAAPLVGAIAASMVYTPNQKIRHYQMALSSAVETRDEAAEQLYLQKLSQLGYGQLHRMEFHAAWALAAEEDKWDEAVSRMELLAPVDEAGYLEAHLWLANGLMKGKIESPDQWQLIETHANHALSLSAGRDRNARNNARLMLARVMERKGQWSKAAKEYDELSESIPYLHFDLMRRRLIENDHKAARSHARKVILICEQLDQQAKDSPADAGGRRLAVRHLHSWAEAVRLVGQDKKAAELILRRGVELFPDDESLGSRLASLISSQLKALQLGDSRVPELLQEVFEFHPHDVKAIDFLVDGASNNPTVARGIVEALIAKNALSAKGCLTLGDARWEKQDPLGSIWYFERAAEIDPESGTAWNNIAWLRGCVDETRDLDRALEAANLAIRIESDARCYETRGQIYVQMKRWEDAIADLERAINGSLPDSVPAHKGLAEAFAARGESERAEAHRRKAGIK